MTGGDETPWKFTTLSGNQDNLFLDWKDHLGLVFLHESIIYSPKRIGKL